MTVEYGVVIRRQLPRGEVKWQLWLGSGMVKEHASFLVVMNHAGAMGFEAVAAGHFDELGVPEVLLQRKMETFTFVPKPASAEPKKEPVAEKPAANAEPKGEKAEPAPAKGAAPKAAAKAPARRKSPAAPKG